MFLGGELYIIMVPGWGGGGGGGVHRAPASDVSLVRNFVW